MEKQIEKIDDVIIASSVAILAAYFVIYSKSTHLNLLISFSAVISVVSFVSCLLFSLYGKYRKSLRKSICDTRTNEWKRNLDIDLDKMMENLVAPQLFKSIKMTLNNEENKKIIQEDSRKIKEVLDNGWKEWEKDLNYPKKLFAENQALKIQKILDESFVGPLKEKHAILKFQLENIASKRYTLFTIGLISFIISIGANLFS